MGSMVRGVFAKKENPSPEGGNFKMSKHPSPSKEIHFEMQKTTLP